jgi:hypothetical protein
MAFGYEVLSADEGRGLRRPSDGVTQPRRSCRGGKITGWVHASALPFFEFRRICLGQEWFQAQEGTRSGNAECLNRRVFYS